jgi:glycosyltransferase involved in cell wall biosynthesis
MKAEASPAKESAPRQFYRWLADRGREDVRPLLRRRPVRFPTVTYDAVLVSNVLLPARGGGTRSFLHLAGQLVKSGRRVAAVCLGPAVKQLRENGVDLTWIPTRADLPAVLGSFPWKRLLCQQEWAPDAAAVAAEAGRPFWYFLRSVEDFAPAQAGLFTAGALADRVRELVDVEPRTAHLRDLVTQAECVVANSEFMADLTRLSFGVTASVLLPGIEPPAWYERVAHPLRHAVVAMAASKKKGVMLVVDLARAFPQETFLLCGVKLLPMGLREQSLPPNLHWLGSMEASRAYSLAKLVLVPSLWPEPAGRVAPEAFFRGIPVLASRVGGIPEIVADDAFLVTDFAEPGAWRQRFAELLPRATSGPVRALARNLGRRYLDMQSRQAAELGGRL